jgi:hypothetical protein
MSGIERAATPHQSVILDKRSEEENPGRKVEKEGREGLDPRPKGPRMTKVRWGSRMTKVM